MEGEERRVEINSMYPYAAALCGWSRTEGRSLGKEVSLGLEAVLVGDEAVRDGLALGVDVRDGSLHHDCLVVCSLVLDRSGFLASGAVTRLEAVTIYILRNVASRNNVKFLTARRYNSHSQLYTFQNSLT